MRKDPRPQGQGSSPLRWFCGVPVFLNPLFLFDVASATVLLWCLTALVMVLCQSFLGSGPLLPSHFTAAGVYAGYTAALLPLLYTAVSLIFYRKGFLTLYRFEKNGIFMETMRAAKDQPFALFCTKPFPAPENCNPFRSVSKDVSWDEVRRVEEIPSLRVLLIKGRWGTRLRVWCPDEETYGAALSFADARLHQDFPQRG